MTIENIEIISNIIQNIISSLGIILAGVWAFFTFVIGRSHKAHVSLHSELTGLISTLDNQSFVIIHIRAKNIGKTKARNNRSIVTISQVNLLHSTSLPKRLDIPVTLQTGKTYRIFENHEFLEPNEEIHEDIILLLDNDCLYKAKFLWKDKKTDWATSITINKRLIINNGPY